MISAITGLITIGLQLRIVYDDASLVLAYTRDYSPSYSCLGYCGGVWFRLKWPRTSSIAAVRGIELIAEVARRLEEAARSNHRVLVYLANECVQRGIFKSILDQFIGVKDNPRILLAYREREDLGRGC
jgi:hypothetical protein